MMRQSRRLIEQIVAAVERRGLTAGDLAARAGIAAANLSRIRRSGRFSGDTLERLLGAADLELSVRPREDSPTAGRTLALVTRKLNAGRRERLTSDELRRLLTRFRVSQAARRAFSHLVGVIEEVPLEQLHDLVRAGDATLPSLARIAAWVEGEGPAVAWLEEQLGASVGMARPA